MEKLLSVIIPSYNMEKYLPKCLGSFMIADCELRNRLDVIVVNDGSKDRTSEIAHEFEKKYPGVFRVIDKANGHYGSCVNAGLEAAEGAYVKVVDADDWVDADGLTELLRHIKNKINDSGSAPDAVFCDFDFVRGDRLIRKSYSYVAAQGFSIADFSYRDGRDPWMHAVTYKTENLRQIKYEQLTGITHTDVQWLHAPMATVTSIEYLPVVVYKYFDMREGNTTSQDGFFKTFPDLVKVTCHLIRQYENDAVRFGELGRDYLKKHLRYRAMRVYYMYIRVSNTAITNQVLDEFDHFVQENAPWLYRELEDETLGGADWAKYIKLWRQHRKMSFCLRTVVTIARVSGRMRRMFK